MTQAELERARVVAWLMEIAAAFPTHPYLWFIGDPALDEGTDLCLVLADAIERGEHLNLDATVAHSIHRGIRGTQQPSTHSDALRASTGKIEEG